MRGELAQLRDAEAIVEPVESSGIDLEVLLTGVSIGDVVSNGDLIPPPPPMPPRRKEPVRVGGQIAPPQKLNRVDPIYPPIAIAARKEGVVILEALLTDLEALERAATYF